MDNIHGHLNYYIYIWQSGNDSKNEEESEFFMQNEEDEILQ